MSASTSVPPPVTHPVPVPVDAAPSRARRLFEVITVGLPFSTFKLLVGLLLWTTGARAGAIVGAALLALGVVDLAMNAANAVGLILVRRPYGPLCLLNAVVRALRGPHAAFEELGLALDTALAFVLVAGMIATSSLTLLPGTWLWVWNVAVILNVLGAGTLRLLDAIDRATAAVRVS